MTEALIHILDRDPVADCYTSDLEKVLGQSGLHRHRALYRYWRRMAGDRAYPAREDLDPAHIPKLLPNVFLADVLRFDDRPNDYLYRLIGTAIVDIEGEWTGTSLGEMLPDREELSLLWQQYDTAADGIASFRREKVKWEEEKRLVYEVLLLPLSSDGETVDMLLGMASRGQ